MSMQYSESSSAPHNNRKYLQTSQHKRLAKLFPLQIRF